VVIEEDGKTEEEFVAEILDLRDELEHLTKDARKLDNTITGNLNVLAGES
jgi:type I restriction enzyme M protein